jgi:hypothetical protein
MEDETVKDEPVDLYEYRLRRLLSKKKELEQELKVTTLSIEFLRVLDVYVDTEDMATFRLQLETIEKLLAEIIST